MPKATLNSSAPILLVSDVMTSANYYRDKVGFSYNGIWEDPPGFCILKRDDLHIMLSRTEVKNIIPHHKVVPRMWNIYFWVNDVKAMCEEMKQRESIIEYDLCEKEYGCLEFGIQDLDGYDIAFGELL